MARNPKVQALGDGRFEVHGIVHRQRPIDDPACDLAALGHLGQDRGIDGRGHGRAYRLDRRQKRDLGQGNANGPGQIDGILSDVDLLHQVRRDGDGSVGDEDQAVKVAAVHNEHVAQPSAGPQAAVAPNNGAQEVFCVQMPLHQGANRTISNQRHALFCCANRVGRLDQGNALEVRTERLGDGRDLAAIAD